MKSIGILIFSLVSAVAQTAPSSKQAIEWLLQNDQVLAKMPLPVVIQSATGHRVLPLDAASEALLLLPLSEALNRTLARLNDPTHAIHQIGRINEASREIENLLTAELNRIPGWSAAPPLTAIGTAQRSGYPDIRLKLPTGKIVYLDPKLMTLENRESSLRTFYYEPKRETNKINDDAIHLLVGVQHNGKLGADLRLTAWELVDLSQVILEFKPEFQASNRDLYRPNSVIKSSASSPPKLNPDEAWKPGHASAED